MTIDGLLPAGSRASVPDSDYNNQDILFLLLAYLTTYSLWSAMPELSLLLNYEVYR